MKKRSEENQNKNKNLEETTITYNCKDRKTFNLVLDILQLVHREGILGSRITRAGTALFKTNRIIIKEEE